jgi:hypothetical protein
MIKQLFFTAALLAPSLAYAGNPSADLTIQIGPPPPPNPVVPAPAAAAGLTTQVLNADFSQPAYSNIANWVDGCGGPTSGNRWTYRFLKNSAGGAPCAYLLMETDSTIGKQVLHLSVPTSDPTNAYDINWPGVPFTAPVVAFAPEMYVEITTRMSLASLKQTNSAYPWGGELAIGYDAGANWLEPDFFEVATNPNSNNSWVYGDGVAEWVNSAIHNGIFSSPPNGLATDMSVYHTYGILFTSDGSTNYSKCMYLDGGILGCGEFNLTNPNNLKYHNYIFNMIFGNDAGSNNMDIYIQSFKIWACPNSFGTSTLCAGTVITH